MKTIKPISKDCFEDWDDNYEMVRGMTLLLLFQIATVGLEAISLIH